MGDGDAGVRGRYPHGTGGDARPREVTQVRDRLRRDQEASHIPVGRRPAELVRCVTVRSWAVDAPAQRLSIAAAVDRYCDKKRSFEAKPWATLIETMPSTTTRATVPAPKGAASTNGAAPVAMPWLRAQSINVTRHAAALRPFRLDEFGTGAEAPTAGHTHAVNNLITGLRRGLLHVAGRVRKSGVGAAQEPSTTRLQDLMRKKEHAHKWVRGIEKIWDFYFEVFGQRQTRYAKWLLSCDRIGLDCYRASYLGLGVARTIPAPPPFSYMATGFAPATFRRGIPLKRLGKQLNPFPLIQLPYHRLINPWTLGAVLHEVSHNLQIDLGLSQGRSAQGRACAC